MKLLTILFVLFTALPALGQARFMQLGDPQFGRGCIDSPYDVAPEYENMTHKNCLHRQQRQLIAQIEYGIARNADFFWFMGDMVEAGATAQAKDSDERTALGEVLDMYPNETFYYTPGNHDYDTSDCTDHRRYILNAVNNQCTDTNSGNTPDGADNCPGTMTADQDSGSADGYCDDFDTYGACRNIRIPLWDSWIVNNVHFFSVHGGLFGPSSTACTGRTAQCVDIDNNVGTACSANDDKEGRGTSTECLIDEVCEDFAGYDDDQMTAFDAWVDAYVVAKAAGTANAIFGAAHYPWITRDDTTATSTGLDFDNGSTTWRGQMETALDQAGVGTSATHPFYWLFGHVHDFLCFGGLDSAGSNPDKTWDCSSPAGTETGLTSPLGVYYQDYSDSGSGDTANQDPDLPLGNLFWEVDEDGIATRTFVGAGGQLGGGR
jgi:hypothetical protein